MSVYAITACWDADAKTWVAESDDVPGLAIGAPTLDDLIARLVVVIPELLELNAHLVLPHAPRFEVHATKNHERFTLHYDAAA